MITLYLNLIDDEKDKTNFISLYNEYRFLMLHIANEILHDIHLSEDAVQEAFIRIAKNFKKIKEPISRETKAFVVIVTRNVSINMYNQQNKITDIQDCLLDNISIHSNELFNTISYEILAEYIFSLPEKYKDVLYLYHIYGYNFNEIANLLGITIETAKKRAQRARKLLKDTLEKEEYIYE